MDFNDDLDPDDVADLADLGRKAVREDQRPATEAMTADESGDGISKHDADCLRRQGELGALLCSCDLSDDQVNEGVMVVLSPQARLVPTRGTGDLITYPTLRIRRVDS